MTAENDKKMIVFFDQKYLTHYYQKIEAIYNINIYYFDVTKYISNEDIIEDLRILANRKRLKRVI